MLGYYFKLGVRSLRRNPVLTALMILTLAVGVAASMSALTILYVMSGDPIPHKSDRLVVPLIDNGPLRDYTPGHPPEFPLMSYKDAANLLRDGYGERRTALYDVGGTVVPARRDLPLVSLDGAAVTADFFPMFEVPFLHGRAWTAREDQANARVLVLSRKAAEKLYGPDNPVGKRIRIFGTEFEVVGMLDAWAPLPRYTHLINGSGGGTYDGEDAIFIPFSTAIDLQIKTNGSTDCTGDSAPGFQGRLDSECTWIQFWYELKSGAEVSSLRAHLQSYMEEQRKLGRLPRPEPVRLFDVMQWMSHLQVVGSDSRIAVWLAFGFLLLCLFNTMGLLLAKFSVRAAEVGVRRALGASRGAIFRQFLVESGVIGVTGGAFGLLLALGCLRLIALQSAELSVLARMDWAMLGLTLLLSIGASLLAGLLPTWRACQVTPAIQLKSQ